MLAAQLREHVRFSHRMPEEKQILLTALVPYTVTYTVQEGPQHVSNSACTYTHTHTVRSCQAVHHCPPDRGGGVWGGAALAAIINHVLFFHSVIKVSKYT